MRTNGVTIRGASVCMEWLGTHTGFHSMHWYAPRSFTQHGICSSSLLVYFHRRRELRDTLEVHPALP